MAATVPWPVTKRSGKETLPYTSYRDRVWEVKIAPVFELHPSHENQQNRSSWVSQWVKDSALSLWLGFDPWPGDFCMQRGENKTKNNVKGIKV